MTPSGINKPLHLFIYIGGAVVVDKIIFPAAYMQLVTPSKVAIAVRMQMAIINIRKILLISHKFKKYIIT